MSDCNNVNKRGSNNPNNDAYDDTVATYTSPGEPTVSNVATDLTCASSVYVGAVVRMSGTTVVNALADSGTNSRVIGICVAKSSSTLCTVQFCGFTDTIFTGLSANTNYFLSESTLGGITTTPPTGSGEIIIHIGRTLTSSQLVIQIGTQVRRAT